MLGQLAGRADFAALDILMAGSGPHRTGFDRKSVLAGAGMSGDWSM
ncbi:MAG: hypothetical protein WBP94_11795 [Rhodomicrobiaceae bacterium]